MIEGFYFITDRRLSKLSPVEQAEAALAGGAKIIQYREKRLAEKEMIAEAVEIKKACGRAGALFIVNDWPAVAAAAGADGAHVGRKDACYSEARKAVGAGGVVGVSASTVEEAMAAEKAGADYIGLGPVFATATKKDAAPPGGLELVREARKRVSIPLIAIGGITLANVEAVISAGADGAAAISEVLRSGSIEETVREFGKKIARALMAKL